MNLADLDDALRNLPTYLTVMEVAALLRVGRSMAYDLARRGEIPAINIGRVVRIPRDALVDWLQQRQKQS